MSRRISYKNRWFVYLIYTVIALFLFGETFEHDFSLDDNYVLANVPEDLSSLEDALGSFTTPFDRVDYRPIPVFTYALQEIVFGSLESETSHLMNVLLYILGALALHRMILVFFQFDDRKYLIAFGAVLLFIAHPIHSNVVASLKNRDILMSFLFAIMAFTAYMKFFNHNKMRYVLVCFLFTLCALLCKLDSVWVIMMIPVYYFMRKGKVNYHLIFKTSIVFLLATVLLIIRFKIANIATDALVDENPIHFTENPMVGSSLLKLVFYPLVSFFYYVKFMIIPFGYYFYFGYNTIPTPHLFYPYFIFGMLLFAATIYWLVRSYRTDKTICLTFCLYLTSILFFLNIFKPVAGVVAPRLAFHASSAFCILLMILIYKLAESDFINDLLAGNERFVKVDYRAIILTVLIIAFYTPFTISRNMDWKDRITLMDADHPFLKHSYQANRIASNIYLREVEKVDLSVATDQQTDWVRKGLLTSQRAAKIDPTSIFAKEGIGIAYMLLGDKEKAFQQFNYIIENFENSFVSWDFLGDIYHERNDFINAEICYKRALDLDPYVDYVYSKLKTVMLSSRRFDEANEYFSEKISTYPDFYMPYQILGQIYLTFNDTIMGSQYYTMAFERGSEDVDTYLEIEEFLKVNNYLIELQELKNAIYSR